MKLHRVIGHVTLSRCHPTYTGALLATESCGDELLGRPSSSDADLVIVWDDLGAGLGNTIAVSDGGEAAAPFKPDQKAVDAYCSAILDKVHIAPQFKHQS